MNKKAQIISLDFLLSLVAVMLCIGLMIQFTETRSYSSRQRQELSELQTIAETASLMLISNPEISCDIKDDYGSKTGSIGLNLLNCIDASAAVDAAKLGIDEEKYEFQVVVNDSIFAGKEELPKNKDFFSVKRTVLAKNGKATKAEISSMQAAEATVRVWKK